MGSLKSRLFHKKDNHPAHATTASETTQNTNQGQQEIDQAIMSGPNRARIAEGHSSDNSNVPAAAHNTAEMALKATNVRART